MEEKYKQIALLITSIFYYGNFKAETYNEKLLEKLLIEVNLWPTNEQKILQSSELLTNLTQDTNPKE